MHIIGHKRQVQYFNTIIERGNLAHAYLLFGGAHVGKFTLARALAKTFFCDSLRDARNIEEVCNVCPACVAIDAQTYPHVSVLDSENAGEDKKEKKNEIGIAEIRRLKRAFSFSAASAMRFVIINQAEKMTREAANAFLKLLEEPGGRTCFLLLTSSPDLMLPTILSRTQRMYVGSVSSDEMRSGLSECFGTAPYIDNFLLLAGGRPGIAVRFFENKDAYKEEARICKNYAALFGSGDISEAFVVSEQAGRDISARESMIENAVRAVRERMMQGDGKAIQALKRIDRYASFLETSNVNPRMACDAIMLEAITR